MDKIIAVVITYNRRKLLQECVEALLNQTHQLHKIIIFDNGSTDDTYAVLKNNYLCDKKIDYMRVDTNIGAGAGWVRATNRAMEYGGDWLWIMDDDTEPLQDSLEKLIIANGKITTKSKESFSGNKVAFLASRVLGNSGENMNVPEISSRKALNGYSYAYKYLDNGLVCIESATFVSLLVKTKAIEKCGVQYDGFSMWGIDTEFTLRLFENYGDGYLVGDSIAIHKRKLEKALMFEYEDDRDRIRMWRSSFKFDYIMKRYYKKKNPLILVLKSTIYSLIISKKGLIKSIVVIQGTIDGIIGYKRYINYLKTKGI